MNHLLRYGRILFVLTAIFAFAVPAIAQEQTVSLSGVVSDQGGDALPGVVITATNDRGLTFTTSTDNRGWYRFASVPPGTYTITAELAGMDTATAESVRAALGSQKKIDFNMKLSALAEAITVTVSAPVVDVTSSATAATITSDQIEKLPLGRDFTSAVSLVAGANQESAAGGVSVNGASGSENQWVLDGVNVTDPSDGTVGTSVVTDFVDEIQVKSAGYAAEYGGAIGGVVNALTKTGGNDFRGSVNVYYTDESFNGDIRPGLVVSAADDTKSAYEFYDNDDETILEPGFNLGGPIVRNKVWFFAAYQPRIRNTDRTVTFTDGVTDTFSQDSQQDYGAASLSGTLGSKFLWKGVYNTGGYETNDLLPTRTGRASSGQDDYQGRVTERTQWNAAAYTDYMATSNVALSLRGGRFNQNVEQGGYPSDPRFWNWRNSPCPQFPDVTGDLCQPSGFATPNPSSINQDEYTRDNVNFDVSWFTNFGGAHTIKAGVQMEDLSNEVDSGNTAPVFRIAWGTTTPWWGSEFSGPYGQVGVYEFKTAGSVDNKITSVFLQDSWTTFNNRLTLNFGVRAEKEQVPGYADPSLGLQQYAIEFDYSDKTAPRLGFAYDIKGDGRWKAYGSYGTFYDITKLEMPRGSFGGAKWIWYNFAIMDPNWKEWSCVNDNWTSGSSIPTCSNHLSYIGNIDLRAPSYDLVEPNLKPMESKEYTLGTDYELSPSMSVGMRYIHKELVRTIEDVGVLVDLGNGSSAEEYFTANPGFGVATNILGNEFPAFPKAVRDYDAIDITFTKRFAGNWALNANYVYSELTGNYAGLANSDEVNFAGAGRTDPNVSRYADSLFNQFDASGSLIPVKGKLGTDRPHQFKLQASYAFTFGTTLSFNQYYGSGTPKSTEMEYHGVGFFPYGRGDLGRTPSLTQSDLFMAHEFRVFGDQSIELGLNILNLFDEDTPIYFDNLYSESSVELADDAAFFAGFDPVAALPFGQDNPTFNQAAAFQSPREVRFHVKYRF